MTQEREDFERKLRLKGSLEKQKEPVGEGPSDKEFLDKEIVDKERFYKDLFDREDKERGVKRRSKDMMSPEPGKLSIELSVVKQEKQERMKYLEDETALVLNAWKSMEGSGTCMADSLLSNFFGDKIERLKEDLSHMIQLELEEMKEIEPQDDSEETSTGNASREEEKVIAEFDEYEAVVNIEEAEPILPDIIAEENIPLDPEYSWY